MSQGAAPVGPATGPTGGVVPSVPGQTGPTQMTMPNGPAPEPPGMWAGIKDMIGETAGSFVEMLGDNPEERMQNLQTFQEAVGHINELGAKLGQSTLMQRMGQKKGAEMVSRANQPPPPPMAPSPMLSPDQLAQIYSNVGMGVQGIQAAGPNAARKWPG